MCLPMAEYFGKPTGSSARRAFGYAGLGLAALAAVAIVGGLPWQIRFPLVVTAVLFGPGVPLMVALSQLPAVKSVVLGIGLDMSLLLLAGEGMVLMHVWQPDYAVGVLLICSVIASVRLLFQSYVSRHRSGNA